MQIEKAKLPKGMSYALRSSVLERAICEAGIDIATTLRHGPNHILFDAFFWPPNPNFPFERLYVRAGAVPASHAHEARLFVESSVIPDLISWLQGILALPSNSPIRRERQEFYRGF